MPLAQGLLNLLKTASSFESLLAQEIRAPFTFYRADYLLPGIFGMAEYRHPHPRNPDFLSCVEHSISLDAELGLY